MEDQDDAWRARCNWLDGNNQETYRLAPTLLTNSNGTRKPQALRGHRAMRRARSNGDWLTGAGGFNP
jgi:hypothetical protein